MARPSQKRSFRAQLKQEKKERNQRALVAFERVFSNTYLWKEIMMRLRKLVGCGFRDVLKISMVCRKARDAIFLLPLRIWHFYYPMFCYILDELGLPGITETYGTKGNILAKILYLKYQYTGVLDPKVPKWVEKMWKPIEPDCLRYFGASEQEAEKITFVLYRIPRCHKLDHWINDCQCDIPQLCNVGKNRMDRLKKDRKRYSNGAKARNSK